MLGCHYSADDTDKYCCHHLFWRIHQKSNAHKSFVAFYTFAGNICWTQMLFGIVAGEKKILSILLQNYL